MALDKESVKLGIKILRQINNDANNIYKIYRYDKNTPYIDTDKIYCVDEKYDNGYENVFTNILNITPEQLKLWEELKDQVPNSCFIRKLNDDDYPYYWDESKKKNKDNITCLGWF